MSVISNNILAGSSGQGGAAGYAIERSLRFNPGDSAYLNRTPSSAGNRKTWTWSGWVKRSALGTVQSLFHANTGQIHRFMFNTDDKLYWVWGNGSAWRNTDAVYRDASAWYHIMLVSDTDNATASNRLRFYVNGIEQSTSGTTVTSGQEWDINTAVPHRIGSFVSAGTDVNFLNGYLADIQFIDGQALAASDFGEYDDNNVWQPKEYAGTYGTNGFHLDFSDNSTAAALGTDTSGNGNTWTVNNLSASNILPYSATATVTSTTSAGHEPTSKLFDNNISTSNGYFAISTGGTHNVTVTFSPKLPAGSTIELYGWKNSSASSGVVEVNGTDVSSVISNQWNSPPAWANVSSAASGGIQTIKLYRQDGVQNPAIAGIRVDGTVLVDGATTYTDSLVDSPVNGDSANDTGAGGEVSGNYCTLNNVIAKIYYVYDATNGALDFYSSSFWQSSFGTFLIPSSGKWYYEIEAGGVNTLGGIVDATDKLDAANHIGSVSLSYLYAFSSGAKILGPSNTHTTYGATGAAGDFMGVAIDMDAGTLVFYKNGVSQGTAFTGLTGSYVPTLSTNASGGGTATTNFGQRAFAYTAPSGYKALCTANLPDPTIADGSTAFDTKLYTGNGSTQTISGLNFSPDFVWIKNRTDSAAHRLLDTIRGATEVLYSDFTDAETTESTSLTAFNSDGFAAGSENGVNGLNDAIVAWAWDGGSSTVTNTDGSISAQVRANPSAGFSIVSYTGTSANATVGHGLNAAPEMIIIKNRDNSYGFWPVYHKSITANNYLQLNATTASQGSVAFFNDTEPTSSVFSIGISFAINKTNEDLIAYCFAPVEGYSAFGSYEGNGSANGPFVYTGFRPAFVLTKWADGTDQWQIHDTSRSPDNVASEILMPNTSSAEQNYIYSEIDILSNGFKLRNSNQNINAASTYIYAAFAENPFKTSRAR